MSEVSNRSIQFKKTHVYAENDTMKMTPLFSVDIMITEIADNVLIKGYSIDWEQA